MKIVQIVSIYTSILSKSWVTRPRLTSSKRMTSTNFVVRLSCHARKSLGWKYRSLSFSLFCHGRPEVQRSRFVCHQIWMSILACPKWYPHFIQLASFHSHANPQFNIANKSCSHNQQIESKESGETRIQFLSKLLECDEATAVKLIQGNVHFSAYTPENIKEKVDIVKSAGLPISFILKHPKVIQHSSAKTLTERLTRLKKAGLLNNRSLLADSSLAYALGKSHIEFEDIFDAMCKKIKSEEWFSDIKEYLQYLIDISGESDPITVDNLIKKYDNFSVNLWDDIREKVNLIDSVGLPVSLILKYPQLIKCPTQTITQRLEKLEEEGLLSNRSVLTDSRLVRALEESDQRFEEILKIMCNIFPAHKTVGQNRERIDFLSELLECDTATAQKLYGEHHQFSFPYKVLQDKVDTIKSFNIPLSFIIQHPVVLKIVDAKQLNRRLSLLDKYGLFDYKYVLSDAKLAVCLYGHKDKFEKLLKNLLLRKAALKGFLDLNGYLQHLVDFSGMSEALTVDGLIRDHPFFKHVSPENIKEKIDILKSFDVSTSIVLHNPRILAQTSALVLTERLIKLKEAGLLDNRHISSDAKLSFMLEANTKFFENGFQRMLAIQAALEGQPNKIKYLEHRLKISPEMAEEILSCKKPSLASISEMKWKQHFDFYLIELGLSPEFVVQYIKLVSYSVDKQRERVEQLEKAGVNLSPELLAKYWHMSETKFQRLKEASFDFALL